MDSSDSGFFANIPSFYPAKLPAVGDYVVAKVTRVTCSGIYVDLLEYAFTEAAIAGSELSGRGFQDANKLVWKGRQIVAVVLRVERGCIDLSKKQVPANLVNATEQKFADNKRVFTIAKSVALRLGVSIQKVYDTLIYPLYTAHQNPYEVFKQFQANEDSGLFSLLPADWIDCLQDVIKSRIKPKRVYVNVEVVVSSLEGVDQVRSILLAGSTTADYDRELKITVKAAPKYIVTSFAPTQAEAEAQIKEALSKMKARAEVLRASFSMKSSF
mmetsp:Transcript_1742/g.3701  ORF Transcript_1742/g.3701 Transcript_1742/m.3701 type:complete len:271 (+) Transcript_1742:849-1661(+)|eukprot:CAMPEP_0204910452 /NCGR_PEP_ID=MMETSP1397-20131031/8973_1 /ASSEMBLY_ACC=CAM_ASM_000891 /TAXON_ID=49980 /ORGANISM="Climacostomum Climacostomum virens, Strain Stock W-24" /LENGTH=270 /DNA_ID=CAMNT_0052080633 /DNA_START=696 /DNA_END=1508 /DNA_ORIENTATION=-